MKLSIPAPKKRVHQVLFAANSPFKAKTEKNRGRAYVRKPKHSNTYE